MMSTESRRALNEYKGSIVPESFPSRDTAGFRGEGDDDEELLPPAEDMIGIRMLRPRAVPPRKSIGTSMLWPLTTHSN